MAMSSVLSLSLCFLVFFHCCQAGRQEQQQEQHRLRGQSECRIQNLDALKPTNRIKSEGGVIESWDSNNEQLQCAGVSVVRYTIEPRGLLLPVFHNAPKLTYIVQGRGIQGHMIPGCPETFQSSQESQQGGGSRRFQDQHQKIRHFREGDILAFPAGVAHWCYNDGDSPVVAVALLDTSNDANQLDLNPRSFYLAGNPQQEHQQQEGRERGQEQERSGNNIFSGFDLRLLAEAFGVSTETARKLQSQNDRRGNIVKVEGELKVIRPPRMREEREEQEQGQGRGNGLEETLCSLRLRENIGDPSRADVFTPQAGRISSLNSLNLPILRRLQLSAERGVLYRNAIMAPHYNLNAHSVCYVTRGRAQVQIVDNNGQSVFNGELREGQILVEPQNFAVIKQAGNEGFEWVSFKTDDNAMISPLAGRTSVIRAMPEEVLANAYQISREDARRLKYNREETTVFAPSSRSERRAYA